jgi:hypothetical protein
VRSGSQTCALRGVGIGRDCAGGTTLDEPFGSRYRIPLEPDPPTLSATTVSVTAIYGGCRGNHTFALRHRIQAGATSIWLPKTTPDEACDMLVTERREFPLPAACRPREP